LALQIAITMKNYKKESVISPIPVAATEGRDLLFYSKINPLQHVKWNWHIIMSQHG